MEQRSVRPGKTKSDGRVRTAHQPPSEVEVGYLEVAVDTSQDSLTRSVYNTGSSVFGTYDERTGTIVLDTTVPLRVQQESLLHELLHAIVKQTGMNLDEDKEETLIRTLSPFILMMIRRNPDLVRFFQR
jgi:hypothetical protein